MNESSNGIEWNRMIESSNESNENEWNNGLNRMEWNE